MRGSESTTAPAVWLYEDAAGPPNAEASSALWNTGVVSRGKVWSAAP